MRLAVVLMCALAAQARGEGVAVIAIDPATPRPLDRAAADRLLVGALAQRGPVVGDALALALARAQAGARPATELAFFGAAQGKLREAWKAYTLADSARALAVMDEVLPLYEAHLDFPGVSDALADLWLRRGAAELQAGRTAEARGAVRRARVMDGERTVGRDEFHPDVVALVDAVDREVAAGPRARLVVRVTPAADEVWVDGEPVGQGGEVAVDELTAGQHVVWAFARGRRAAGALVEVPGAELALALPEEARVAALEAARAALRAGGAAGPARAALELVRELAGVDEVVIGAVGWRGGELAVSGQRCAGVPLACGGVREVRAARRSQLAAAAHELATTMERGSGALTLLESESVTESEPPSPIALIGPGGRVEVPDGGGERPWYRRKWVWAVAGGAVVVLGAATWLAVSAEDTVTTRLTVDPATFGR